MHNPEADEIDPQDLEAAAELYDRIVKTPAPKDAQPLSEIARDFLAARKTCRELADAFQFQIEHQYGPYRPIQEALELPFTPAITAAYIAMIKGLTNKAEEK